VARSAAAVAAAASLPQRRRYWALPIKTRISSNILRILLVEAAGQIGLFCPRPPCSFAVDDLELGEFLRVDR
jgi:hypothetical protein